MKEDHFEATSQSTQENVNQNLINISLRYLSLREYSEKELKRKVIAKEYFSDKDFAKTFEYLKSKNYLNDERYIRQKSNLLKLKGFSDQYIVNYLRREELDVTIEQVSDLGLSSDNEIIKKLILKKTKSSPISNLSNKRLNSIKRYLYSKGHDIQSITSALNSMEESH